MGLTEDLTTLQDLHEKGKLTDQEFADAKATTLRTYLQEGYIQEGEVPVENSSSRSSSGQRILGVLAILLLLLGLIWYEAGTKRTTEMIATVIHAPITIKDEVENLPAASWKGVALNLPYSGTVDVNLEVVRGNPIDVFIATVDQLEIMNTGHWNQVQAEGDFSASKTTTYKRSGHLNRGGYYLVLRDTSLGILSMPASDVSVRVCS